MFDGCKGGQYINFVYRILHMAELLIKSSIKLSIFILPIDMVCKLQLYFHLLKMFCWLFCIFSYQLQSIIYILSYIIFNSLLTLYLILRPKGLFKTMKSLKYWHLQFIVICIQLNFVMSKWSGPSKILRHRNGSR